jgi:hypothetical protein
VKTGVKAGRYSGVPYHNHNEPRVRDAAQAEGLKVKTGVKAGALGHNRKFGYKKWPCLHIRTFNA